jgi:hypothetical protein
LVIDESLYDAGVSMISTARSVPMGGAPIDVHALQDVLNTMASLARGGQGGQVSNIVLLKQVVTREGLIRQLQAAQVTAVAQMVVLTAPATRRARGISGDGDPTALRRRHSCHL